MMYRGAGGLGRLQSLAGNSVLLGSLLLELLLLELLEGTLGEGLSFSTRKMNGISEYGPKLNRAL